jgi:hypothetical protein
MKNIHNSVWVYGGLALLVILLHAIFQIPQSEGYNPSDDGVILAQAFRILNGQIPHVDFISIRPVGSAVFHSISLMLPFPIETTARWITLFEYLIIAILWSNILFRVLPQKVQSTFTLILLSTLVFVLTENFYNLFPWTTIDALFFFSMGFFVYQYWAQQSLSRAGHFMRYSLIVFFIGYAALCRQTFALPTLLLALFAGFESVKNKRLWAFVSGAFLGLWPYILYLIILLKNNGLTNFYDQLTGRTELWQTGFLKFGHQFWTNPASLVFLAAIILLLIFRFFYPRIEGGITKRWQVGISLSLTFVFLLFLFAIFIDRDHLFNYSFSLFGLLVSALFLFPLFSLRISGPHSIFLWILFIAWTAAISLGDNSPVFAIGLLGGGLPPETCVRG